MAKVSPRLIARQNSPRGLAGTLARLFQAFGTATVVSGQTSIAVADTDIAASDLVICSVLTKGTNACYVVGVTIVAATSFTIAVNTDPGSGGAVIAYMVVRCPS